MKRWLLSLLGFVFILMVGLPVSAQTDDRPLILPIAGEPGPNTWLFGQPYGNTTGAYNFGMRWYRAGQGLHFGVDFRAPCGTPLQAVADGVVAGVDDLARGAGPHNLILHHPELSITSLYGHLLERTELSVGQQVTQGDIVGLSGDPDDTCDSRPHLHFEIRSTDYNQAFNPIDYIDANWHTLSVIGGYGYPFFQQDMANPRRWVTLRNQPTTTFGGAILNDYGSTWPPPFDQQPPGSLLPERPYSPLPDETSWNLRRIGFDNCCRTFWWDAQDGNRLYVIDGSDGRGAGVFAWSAARGEPIELMGAAPPEPTSPDGTYIIEYADGYATLTNRATGETIQTPQLGAVPALSPDNARLTWTTTNGQNIPGHVEPIGTVWVADRTGYNMQQITSGTGLGGQWLDSNRLLLSQQLDDQARTLSVYDLRDDSQYTLGTFTRLTGLRISPGGGHLSYYLRWQDDPADSGIYLLETQPDAQPQKMPWFGAWRWRDAGSLYYIPFNPSQAAQTLAYYNVTTGESRTLLTPQDATFTIMNGDWKVSADSRTIAFHNAVDRQLWLLEGTAP